MFYWNFEPCEIGSITDMSPLRPKNLPLFWICQISIRSASPTITTKACEGRGDRSDHRHITFEVIYFDTYAILGVFLLLIVIRL